MPAAGTPSWAPSHAELTKAAAADPVLLLVGELVVSEQLAGEEGAPERNNRRAEGDDKHHANPNGKRSSCDGRTLIRRTLTSLPRLSQARHQISGTTGDFVTCRTSLVRPEGLEPPTF